MSERELVDEEGENQALRSFLMQYSCDRSITVGTMLAHMNRAGWRGTAPAFTLGVPPGVHLTKAGAQLWIRHLLSMEPAPLPPVQGGSIETAEFIELLEDYGSECRLGFDSRDIEQAKAKLIAHIDAWAARRSAVPDGYAVVPLEANESMIYEGGVGRRDQMVDAADVWRKMVAAASSNNQKEGA